MSSSQQVKHFLHLGNRYFMVGYDSDEQKITVRHYPTDEDLFRKNSYWWSDLDVAKRNAKNKPGDMEVYRLVETTTVQITGGSV